MPLFENELRSCDVLPGAAMHRVDKIEDFLARCYFCSLNRPRTPIAHQLLSRNRFLVAHNELRVDVTLGTNRIGVWGLRPQRGPGAEPLALTCAPKASAQTQSPHPPLHQPKSFRSACRRWSAAADWRAYSRRYRRNSTMLFRST